MTGVRTDASKEARISARDQTVGRTSQGWRTSDSLNYKKEDHQ